MYLLCCELSCDSVSDVVGGVAVVLVGGVAVVLVAPRGWALAWRGGYGGCEGFLVHGSVVGIATG